MKSVILIEKMTDYLLDIKMIQGNITDGKISADLPFFFRRFDNAA